MNSHIFLLTGTGTSTPSTTIDSSSKHLFAVCTLLYDGFLTLSSAHRPQALERSYSTVSELSSNPHMKSERVDVAKLARQSDFLLQKIFFHNQQHMLELLKSNRSKYIGKLIILGDLLRDFQLELDLFTNPQLKIYILPQSRFYCKLLRTTAKF